MEILAARRSHFFFAARRAERREMRLGLGIPRWARPRLVDGVSTVSTATFAGEATGSVAVELSLTSRALPEEEAEAETSGSSRGPCGFSLGSPILPYPGRCAQKSRKRRTAQSSTEPSIAHAAKIDKFVFIICFFRIQT